MATAFSVAFTTTPLPASTKLLVECTRQLSAGVSFVGRSQFKQVFVGAAATTSPANILSGYNTVFGTLVAGKKIFIRLTAISSSGARSAPLVTSAIVA